MASKISALNTCLIETITPQHLNRELLPLEREIVLIGQQCQQVADQLSTELKQVTPDKARGFRSVVQQALNAIWAKQDIENLQGRMEECRKALMMSILVNIQYV